VNKFEMTTKKIVAITVTYGNRIQFLKPIIKELIDQNVSQVVVVDNGAAPESVAEIVLLQEYYPQIAIIKLDKNHGSAVGFKTGIEYAYQQKDCEYIFIIDDDNLPENNTLRHLQDALRTENENTSAVVALRIEREPYQSVASGIEPSKAFPYKNSFLSFDLFSKVKALIAPPTVGVSGNMYLPFAPYGGLYFKKTLIDKIGLPNENFVLYADDHDFTSRIVAQGGKIKLVPEAVIKDLDESWHNKIQVSSFEQYFVGDEKKTFYAVRNRIIFERKNRVTNPMRYTTNMFIYSCLFFIFALKKFSFKRFLIYFKAVRHGYAENLNIQEL